MSNKSKTSSEIIDEVTRIRARNNGVWMAVLELALHVEPDATRLLIKQIVENDQKVTECLSKL